MKKSVQIVLVIALILSVASPGYCGPMRKLSRGFMNMLTCPLELPYRIKQTSKEGGKWYDTIGLGIPKGFGMVIFRGCLGLYEFMTFPVPIPENYEPMVTDPEFFFKSS